MARRARPRAAPAPPQAGLPDATFRRLVVVSLAVGSNLPDVDVLYTSIARGPLSYVLQHRGYTHTLVGAVACAIVLWLAMVLWIRYRRLRATPTEYTWIGAAALGGVLLHLAMDYTNNYGVHPFWPLYDGWVYGDSVYIVEPLMWLAAAPLIFLLDSLAARVLVAVALGLATIAVVAFGVVAPPAVVAFVVIGVLLVGAGKWLAPPAALGVGIALWLAVTAVFILSGRIAAHRLQVLAQAEFPDSRTLDRVLTPAPADPVCWEGWLVQSQVGAEVMRQARISLLPGLIGVQDCRGVNLGAAPSASREAVGAAGDSGIQWLQQYTLPENRIANLAMTQCRARAFMQFARIPMAGTTDTGWWLGDLRFGAGRGRGFSQVQLTVPPQSCDFAPVPWLPPRPELLQPEGAR